MIDLPSLHLLDETDRLLTPGETATFLRTSIKSLERWRATGEGPDFIAMGPRAVRYRLSDLQRFLDERAVRNTAERREQARRPVPTRAREQAALLTRQRNRRGA